MGGETMTFPAEIEERLREEAARSGRSVEETATALLAAALDAAEAERADRELTPEDIAELRAGIERGLAEGAAGRVKPAADVYARLNAKYGIFDGGNDAGN
jgi:plasmid stability protein